jgi:hypothetical protein
LTQFEWPSIVATQFEWPSIVATQFEWPSIVATHAEPPSLSLLLFSDTSHARTVPSRPPVYSCASPSPPSNRGGERQGVGAADVALVVLGRVEENRERARARRARRRAARRRARAEDRGPHLTEPVHSDDDGLLSKGDRGGLKNAEVRKRRVQGERFGTRVVLGSSVLLQKRWQML